MNKLHTLVLAGAILLGLGVSAALAQTQPGPTTTPNPPGCQVNCDPGGEPTSPGDPFDPFGDPEPECQVNCDPKKPGGDPDPECQVDCDPKDPDGDPKKPGGDPKKPGGDPKKPGKGGQAQLGDCGDKLGLLRRVTAAQIQSVGSDAFVDVIPVCRSKSLASEQEEVAQLRPVIGENQVLGSELGRKGFNSANVVGVIVDGRKVVLYVHPR